METTTGKYKISMSNYMENNRANYQSLAQIGLDVYEFRLYIEYLMRADQDGFVYMSTQDLRDITKISERKFWKAKKSLCEKGLIAIVRKYDERGRRIEDSVEVINFIEN